MACTFSSLAQLGTAVRKNAVTGPCVVSKFYENALGRLPVGARPGPLSIPLIGQFTTAGNRIDQLLVDLSPTTAFGSSHPSEVKQEDKRCSSVAMRFRAARSCEGCVAGGAQRRRAAAAPGRHAQRQRNRVRGRNRAARALRLLVLRQRDHSRALGSRPNTGTGDNWTSERGARAAAGRQALALGGHGHVDQGPRQRPPRQLPGLRALGREQRQQDHAAADDRSGHRQDDRQRDHVPQRASRRHRELVRRNGARRHPVVLRRPNSPTRRTSARRTSSRS